MTGDQLFVVAVLGQLVTLAGVIVTYLKTRETSAKADRNSEQVADVARSVDGRLSQLLAEKDERGREAARASRAEGLAAGIQVAAQAVPPPPPTVVVLPAAPVAPTGESKPGGRRATDKPPTGPEEPEVTPK